MNRVNPNTIADALRSLGGAGNLVRQYLHVELVQKTPAAGSYDLTTLQVIETDDWAPAANILWAASSSGTTLGQLAAQQFGNTPTTGQIAPTPNGNIAVLASDAITKVDVLYAPLPGEPVEFTGTVASNALAIPTAYKTRKVLMLLEAEALVGTSIGKKIVLVPSASAASAGQARLDAARENVKFNATDAITSARVKLLLAPEVAMDTKLQADSATL
jgi:hypothetical protein